MPNRRISVDPYLKRLKGKTPKGRQVPVVRGAVVDVVGAHGIKMKRVIVVGTLPPSNFSRAYGRQVLVCSMYSDGAVASSVGAGDAIVRGRVKKIPRECSTAVADYKRAYPSMFRRGKRS